MPTLTITNNGPAAIALKDPDGLTEFVVTVEGGDVRVIDVTINQLERLRPLLDALQAETAPDVTWNATYTAAESVGVAQTGALYVGKHGNDNNLGSTIDKAFLTFSAAVAAADPGNAIVCFDGGTYTERITVPADINIFAPMATLQGPGGTITQGALEINEGLYHFARIIAGNGESGVVKPNTSGTASIHCNRVDVVNAAAGLGVANLSTSQNGVLIAKVNSVFAGEGSSCVGSITQNTGHTHIEAEDLYLVGDNAQGLANAFINGTMVGRVSHIVELDPGPYTSTRAINVQAGRVDVMVGTIQADIAWEVGAGGILSLFYNQAVGSQVATGTVLTSTPT